MKYVGEGYTDAKETTTLLFDRTGDQLDEERRHRVPAYAKLFTNSDNKNTYYILIHQGVPLDPMGPYGRRERALDTQFRKVSKGTFDFYLTYLKTNNSIYLTKAQRGFLND